MRDPVIPRQGVSQSPEGAAPGFHLIAVVSAIAVPACLSPPQGRRLASTPTTQGCTAMASGCLNPPKGRRLVWTSRRTRSPRWRRCTFLNPPQGRRLVKTTVVSCWKGPLRMSQSPKGRRLVKTQRLMSEAVDLKCLNPPQGRRLVKTPDGIHSPMESNLPQSPEGAAPG